MVPFWCNDPSSRFHQKFDTADERNPAPASWDMVKSPIKNTRFHTCWVVIAGFLNHQQYASQFHCPCTIHKKTAIPFTQKTAGFPHKKSCYAPRALTRTCNYTCSRIKLVGGFSPTHLKKYAQSSNWIIVFPKKTHVATTKIKPPPIVNGGVWFIMMALLSYETALCSFKETGHIPSSFS